MMLMSSWTILVPIPLKSSKDLWLVELFSGAPVVFELTCWKVCSVQVFCQGNSSRIPLVVKSYIILLMEEILQTIWGWSFIPSFTRFYTSQVVQDFFHQQYSIISYTHTCIHEPPKLTILKCFKVSVKQIPVDLGMPKMKGCNHCYLPRKKKHTTQCYLVPRQELWPIRRASLHPKVPQECSCALEVLPRSALQYQPLQVLQQKKDVEEISREMVKYYIMIQQELHI